MIQHSILTPLPLQANCISNRRQVPPSNATSNTKKLAPRNRKKIGKRKAEASESAEEIVSDAAKETGSKNTEVAADIRQKDKDVADLLAAFQKVNECMLSWCCEL